MNRTVRNTLAATITAASLLVAAPNAATATLAAAKPQTFTATVTEDPFDDEKVYYGKDPATPLDLTSVFYTQNERGNLRVVLTAGTILGDRQKFREGFAVAIYPNGVDHEYTVHHRADGGLRVVDFNEDGPAGDYKIAGRFTVKPAKNKAIFIIPTSLFNTAKVSVHGLTYLEAKRSGNIKSTDFGTEGRTISIL